MTWGDLSLFPCPLPVLSAHVLALSIAAQKTQGSPRAERCSPALKIPVVPLHVAREGGVQSWLGTMSQHRLWRLWGRVRYGLGPCCPHSCVLLIVTSSCCCGRGLGPPVAEGPGGAEQLLSLRGLPGAQPLGKTWPRARQVQLQKGGAVNAHLQQHLVRATAAYQQHLSWA